MLRRNQLLFSFVGAAVVLLLWCQLDVAMRASSPINTKDCHSQSDAPFPSLHVLYFKQHVSCDSVPEILSSKSTNPFEINALRRRLAIHDPACFDKHFALFRQVFLTRLAQIQKHVHLHIPRSGGTSLCELVQTQSNMTVPTKSNCWTGNFCPMWCGCKNPAPTTCVQLPVDFDFVMNENWLDHPMCEERLYSIVTREPIARTISHVSYFLDAVASRGHEHFGRTKSWRLNLIQSNYMTWSLLAGKYLLDSNMTRARAFHPQQQHLAEAIRVLQQFDFILDFQDNSVECNKVTLDYMVLDGSRLPQSNARGTKVGDYRRDSYEQMNHVDIQLHRYAQRLLRIDCDFFKRLRDDE
jgi:hypothetical protein